MLWFLLFYKAYLVNQEFEMYRRKVHALQMLTKLYPLPNSRFFQYIEAMTSFSCLHLSEIEQ
jgi:hypothetical protein